MPLFAVLRSVGVSCSLAVSSLPSRIQNLRPSLFGFDLDVRRIGFPVDDLVLIRRAEPPRDLACDRDDLFRVELVAFP